MTDQTLRVVIVDDEPLARACVRELVAAHPGVEVIAECGNGFDAVKAVAELRPDLMFLDVQMPKLSGFEVLELLGREVPVIFTTALRPVCAAGVRGACGRLPAEAVRSGAVRRSAVPRPRAARRARALPVEALAGAMRARARRRSSACSFATASKVHVLPVDRIDYVEAQDDYVSFKAEGKQYLKDQTLASVEAQLDPARFVRIHRSYLLNIERIARVELYAKDSRVAILRDGTRLPVSRAGYARLAKLL